MIKTHIRNWLRHYRFYKPAKFLRDTLLDATRSVLNSSEQAVFKGIIITFSIAREWTEVFLFPVLVAKPL